MQALMVFKILRTFIEVVKSVLRGIKPMYYGLANFYQVMDILHHKYTDQNYKKTEGKNHYIRSHMYHN